MPGEILKELGDVLDPGEAIVAVLIEHVWASVVADAVARSGGRALADEVVPTGDIADLGRQVLAISSRWHGRSAAPGGPDC